MAKRSPEDPRVVRNRLIWEDAFAWIGRIFATMVFMVGPALAGLWLDRRLGTKLFSALGVMLGMGLGITALLILVNVKRPSLDEEITKELDQERSALGSGEQAAAREARRSNNNRGTDGDQASL